MAGTGIDRATGAVIAGWPHVQQSLQVLFSTALGTRVMRRYIGSKVPRLVDAPISPVTLIDLYAAMAQAGKLEPRFKITKMAVDPSSTPSAGNLVIAIQGVYYPRGHLGDFSVSEPKIVSVSP